MHNTEHSQYEVHVAAEHISCTIQVPTQELLTTTLPHPTGPPAYSLLLEPSSLTSLNHAT